MGPVISPCVRYSAKIIFISNGIYTHKGGNYTIPEWRSIYATNGDFTNKINVTIRHIDIQATNYHAIFRTDENFIHRHEISDLKKVHPAG